MNRIFLTILLSLFIVSGLEAENREKTEIKRNPVVAKQEPCGEITLNGHTFKIKKPNRLNSPIKTRSQYKTPVIENAPGYTQYYCKDVIGYGLGTPIQAYGVASSINWEGDDAYFLDIVTAAPMGTYVMGSRQNDQIILPMNQTVLEFEDEEYDLNLGLLKTILTIDTDSDGDESIYVWFEYSDDYDSVSYDIFPNGTLILNNPPAKYEMEGPNPADYNLPDYVIGYYYSDDKSWSGYCDILQAYDEFNYELVQMPEDLETHTFSYINSQGMGVIVRVGETDDELYVKGLSAFAPEAVFKGQLSENGTKLSVAPNQFIGLEADLYYIITSTAFLDEDGMLDVLHDGQPAIFNIEREEETGKILSITADDSEYFLAFNDDPFFFYPLDIFMDIHLSSQDSFAGIPSTPEKAYYEDYSTLMGANYIFFELSSFADNGDIIDVNNLFYSIFVNEEPYLFEQEDGINLLDEPVVMYRGIKEPTELVPYMFANDVDLYEDMGGTFVVALYVEGIETVGVQAIYIYEGETTKSGKITIDVETGEQTLTPGTNTKIETLEQNEIQGIEYFNLQGQRIVNPDKGIYIKKTSLSNGESLIKKVMIK